MFNGFPSCVGGATREPNVQSISFPSISVKLYKTFARFSKLFAIGQYSLFSSSFIKDCASDDFVDAGTTFGISGTRFLAPPSSKRNASSTKLPPFGEFTNSFGVNFKEASSMRIISFNLLRIDLSYVAISFSNCNTLPETLVWTSSNKFSDK